MNKGQLWIECTDNTEEDYSARWGSLTDEQMDRIMAFAVEVAGEPDTIA
jgi:hypothetical protein